VDYWLALDDSWGKMMGMGSILFIGADFEVQMQFFLHKFQHQSTDKADQYCDQAGQNSQDG
jgi:hypothetical protein